MSGYKLFYCKTNDEGRRLDRVLKKLLPDVPAGLIYSSLRKGRIKVNNKKKQQSYRIENGDIISVADDLISETLDIENRTAGDCCSKQDAARLKSLIIQQNHNLVFINKPAGMLTHDKNSLADLIKSGLTDVESSLSFTPAPLHRLDRNTSGLVAVSASIAGAKRFSELMRGRIIKKHYIGICINPPDAEIKLENSLIRAENKTESRAAGAHPSAKNALTGVLPLVRRNNLALCLFHIETGITHQIRSQCAAAGFPLAGDVKYGGRCTGFKNYLLHSYSMSLPFYDEICGFSEVTAPLSAWQNGFLESLFGKSNLINTFEIIKNKINSQ